MRIRTRLPSGALLLTAALAFAPSTALAQDSDGKTNRAPRRGLMQRPGGGPGGEQSPEMMMRRLTSMLQGMPVMKALDTDEDGQLSAAEIENASKSLMKLDRDGNGSLSPEELRPEPGPWMNMAGPGGPVGGPQGAGAGPSSPAMMARMFQNRDQDGDGKLSGDEIPDQMRERLGMIDTNGDGSIEKSEMEQAMARRGAAGGNRPGREPGGAGITPRRPPQSEEGNKPDKAKDAENNKKDKQ